MEGASSGTTMKDLEGAQKEPTKVVHCNTCGVDCTNVYYRYEKTIDPAVQTKGGPALQPERCPRCFFEKHFPGTWSAKDFVKISNTDDPSAGGVPEPKWTDEEVLLLLEGLERFDDDWNSVADHVQTKTREQCVMKFLQLEIEDKYEEPEVPQESMSQSQKFIRDLGALTYGRIPIHHADNPILSVVSFLAGLAPANVTEAAVASGRSVNEMRRMLQEKLEKAPTAGSEKGKEKEGSAGASEVKNEDVMEVDSAPSTAVTQDNSSSNGAGNPLVTLPFALSAARASALASHEERHISRLVSGAVNLQLQKLQLKMAHFDDFEKLLSAERRDIQRRRQQLFMDRLAFQRRVRALEDATKKINASLGGAGLPGSMSAEDAVNALTEAIRTFGVGKSEDGVQAKRASVDAGVQPIAEGAEGYNKMEI